MHLSTVLQLAFPPPPAQYETAADLLPSQTALLATVERRRRARSHPDPRLILTRSQRLPFHIAARWEG